MRATADSVFIGVNLLLSSGRRSPAGGGVARSIGIAPGKRESTIEANPIP